jgi:hypothetical protein
MAEYSAEKWIETYQQALIELEHAKMRGRIGDARREIVAPVEKLKSLPGLHARFLEREEDRYDENQRRETLAVAIRKLQSLDPKIRKLDDSVSE